MQENESSELDFRVSQNFPQDTWARKLLYNLEYSEKTGWIYKSFSAVCFLFLFLFSLISGSINFVLFPITIFSILSSFFFTLYCFFKRRRMNYIVVIWLLLMALVFSYSYYTILIFFNGDMLYISFLFFQTTISFLIIFLQISFNNLFYVFDFEAKNNIRLMNINKYTSKKIKIMKILFFILPVVLCAYIVCFKVSFLFYLFSIPSLGVTIHYFLFYSFSFFRRKVLLSLGVQ